MIDILRKIVLHKKQEVIQAQKKIKINNIKEKIYPITKSRRFMSSIVSKYQQKKPAIIAEIKKASPSRGIIREDFEPIEIAKIYQKNGACCLSVLTDKNFFQGDGRYLIDVKKATKLPVLRKDFIIDEYQIYEAKAMGADCILLIASILDEQQIRDFYQLAKDLKMDVLLEVHDKKEMKVALKTPIKLIGVNNRNLRDFNVDINNTIKLKKLITDEDNKILITESGISSFADVQKMLENNIYGFLIGEALMKEKNITRKIQNMFGSLIH
jgi:indole-3-glycerol phosphate synthase